MAEAGRYDSLEIREITPALKGDVLGFFDTDAFADNPDWADCYCMFYHFGGSAAEWERSTAVNNRAAMAARIEAGRMHGLLAYADGAPVGWCNAGPRPLIDGIGASRLSELSSRENAQIGSIVCFVIAAPFRGQGIARSLLATACESFKRQGLKAAEAYPTKQVDSAAEGYHGPLSLYLGAGFVEHRDAGSFVIVRKQLSG